jgi:mono/diheme cytochrome c family protein
VSKAAKLIWVIAILVTMGIAAGGWMVVRRGFSARDEPTKIESFIARRLRTLGIPSEAKNARNPAPASEEALSEAMAHFADHCSICHGNDGSGDTPIGRGLYPRPPDMRLAQTQTLTDGELYYIIHNGLRLSGMPAFGEDTGQPDLDSWKLVHFIRHLPRITPEELELMKTMNPKSPHELAEEDAIRRFLEGEDIQPPSSHNHD